MKRLKTTSVIVRREDGKFLGVSRKYDYNSFGFAGGKCEGNEVPYDCAVRELREETGLEVIAMSLMDIRDYDNHTVNPVSYDEVYCYVVNFWKGELLSNDFLKEKGEGILKWVTPQELLEGAFGDYNREILKKLYRI